jgi:hypothetical protein
MFHDKYLSSSTLGFLKEDFDFLSFYYKHIGKNNEPPPPPWEGPILTPGLLFEQTW